MSEDMSDNINKKTADDYQFSGDEYLAESQESAEHNESVEDENKVEQTDESHGGESFFSSLSGNWHMACEKFPLLQNTRIWIVLGAVLFVIIFLHILGGSSIKPVKKLSPPQPVHIQKAFVQPDPLADSKLHEQLSQLKQNEDERSTNMEQLQGKISNLQSSLDGINSQQAAMTNAIKKLTSYVVSVDNQVTVNKDKLFPKSKSAADQVVFKPIVYHLKAAIPGRVWLKGSNDLTKTVAVGNTISRTYGKVVAIDLVKGVVMTSSGREITYGRDDS